MILIRAAGLLLALSLWAGVLQAQPVGTSFTLQGKLENSGQFVNGNYDFVIEAYDASSGGNFLGSAVGSGVPVEQGEFSLDVDLGNIFTTDTIWLEIQVGTASAGMTVLQGRVPVQATPLSQMALQVPAGAIGDVQIDAARVQLRVSGSCTAGQAMTGVSQDGTVSCVETTPNNSVGTAQIITSEVQRRLSTNCFTGTALAGVLEDGTPICTDLTLADSVGTTEIITTEVQRRVTGSCPAGQAVNTVNEDGTVGCVDVNPAAVSNQALVRKSGEAGTYTSVQQALADLPNWCNDTPSPCVVDIGQGTFDLGTAGLTSSLSTHGLVFRGAGEKLTKLYSSQNVTSLFSSTVTPVVFSHLSMQWGAAENATAMISAPFVELDHVTLELWFNSVVAGSYRLLQTENDTGDLKIQDSTLRIDAPIEPLPSGVTFMLVDTAASNVDIRRSHLSLSVPNGSGIANVDIRGLYLASTGVPVVNIEHSTLEAEGAVDGRMLQNLNNSGPAQIRMAHSRILVETGLVSGMQLFSARLMLENSRIRASNFAVSVNNSTPTGLDSHVLNSSLHSRVNTLDLIGSGGATQDLFRLANSHFLSYGQTASPVSAGSNFVLKCAGVGAESSNSNTFHTTTCP